MELLAIDMAKLDFLLEADAELALAGLKSEAAAAEAEAGVEPAGGKRGYSSEGRTMRPSDWAGVFS